MPLHVDIRLNDQVIEQIHIGRVEPLKVEQSTYTYRVVRGEYLDRSVPWETGTLFTHEYDEGAASCVRKALEALDRASDLTTRT